MSKRRPRAKVWLLELIDPNADGRFRVFGPGKWEKARRAARRWTGTRGPDASSCQWRGEGARANYDADIYEVTVE